MTPADLCDALADAAERVEAAMDAEARRHRGSKRARFTRHAAEAHGMVRKAREWAREPMERGSEPTNTEVPADTHSCACVNPDEWLCYEFRYGLGGHDREVCECPCHYEDEWGDEDWCDEDGSGEG